MSLQVHEVSGLRPSRLRTDPIVGHAFGITFADMHRLVRGAFSKPYLLLDRSIGSWSYPFWWRVGYLGTGLAGTEPGMAVVTPGDGCPQRRGGNVLDLGQDRLEVGVCEEASQLVSV